MTILTKLNDKKPDKLILPLVANEQIPSAPVDGSVESGLDNLSYERQRSRQIFNAKSVLLLLIALMVMCIGIIGGTILYRHYYHTRMQRMRFFAVCGIPYESESVDNQAMLYMNQHYEKIENPQNEADFYNMDDFENKTKFYQDNFFRESMDLDLSDEESYAKIEVPAFRGGRQGRFLHDFKNNLSCIVDVESNRCFIMPLDRETVMPPRSLFDLILKMRVGYYNIDTEELRKDFRVVIPAIEDVDELSMKIAEECDGKNAYNLEKVVRGVYKRSIPLTTSAKFAEFSGNHIVKFNLVNIEEIDDFERKH